MAPLVKVTSLSISLVYEARDREGRTNRKMSLETYMCSYLTVGMSDFNKTRCKNKKSFFLPNPLFMETSYSRFTNEVAVIGTIYNNLFTIVSHNSGHNFVFIMQYMK